MGHMDWYKGNLLWLPDRTIFLTKHGSHAYGTNTPTSDLDIKGVAIPPKEYYLGALKTFEQAECKGDTDAVIYNLQKFFVLAWDNNPNIIEVLFTDPSDFIHCKPVWEEKILPHRDKFISKKAKYTFSGYAVSQLKRIQTHRRWLLNPPTRKPERGDFGLPEQTVIPKDQLQAAEAAIRSQMESWDIACMLPNNLDDATRIAFMEKASHALAEMGLAGKTNTWVSAGRVIGIDEDFLNLMYVERQYTTKLREYQQYQNWKSERNAIRSEMEAKYGYDCYTDDTEFLTNNGWKLFDQITELDELATVFINETNSKMHKHANHLGIEYQRYSYRIDNIFTGDLLRISGHHTDMVITPNHRMLFKKQERVSGKTSEWLLEEAHKLPDTFEILTSITPLKKTYRHPKELSGLPIKPEAFLSLMGWYLSDGTVRRRNGNPRAICISQKKGGKLSWHMSRFYNQYKNKITMSLYEYARKPNKVNPNTIIEQVLVVTDRRIVERLMQQPNKRIPRYCFNMSKRMMDFLMDGLMRGDGTVRPDGTRVYYSKDKALADDVQELGVMCGYLTSLYGPYKSTTQLGELTMHQVWIAKNREQTKRMVRSGVVERIPVKDQRVVCFTVPNGTLVTRRKGCVHFQGNCKHAMHLVRLMRMCHEIMSGKGVIVKRPDAEELLSIRNGAWSYDQLMEWAKNSEAELDRLYETSTLPKVSDRNFLDGLLVDVIESFL